MEETKRPLRRASAHIYIHTHTHTRLLVCDSISLSELKEVPIFWSEACDCFELKDQFTQLFTNICPLCPLQESLSLRFLFILMHDGGWWEFFAAHSFGRWHFKKSTAKSLTESTAVSKIPPSFIHCSSWKTLDSIIKAIIHYFSLLNMNIFWFLQYLWILDKTRHLRMTFVSIFWIVLYQFLTYLNSWWLIS